MELVSSEELFKQLDASSKIAQSIQYSPKLPPVGLLIAAREMPLDRDDSWLELTGFRFKNPGREYTLVGVDGVKFWHLVSQQVKSLDDESNWNIKEELLTRRSIDIDTHVLHTAIYLRMRELGLEVTELARQAGLPNHSDVKALLSFASFPRFAKAEKLARVLQLDPEQISSPRLRDLRDFFRFKLGSHPYEYSSRYGRSAFFHTILTTFLKGEFKEDDLGEKEEGKNSAVTQTTANQNTAEDKTRGLLNGAVSAMAVGDLDKASEHLLKVEEIVFGRSLDTEERGFKAEALSDPKNERYFTREQVEWARLQQSLQRIKS